MAITIDLKAKHRWVRVAVVAVVVPLLLLVMAISLIPALIADVRKGRR